MSASEDFRFDMRLTATSSCPQADGGLGVCVKKNEFSCYLDSVLPGCS